METIWTKGFWQEKNVDYLLVVQEVNRFWITRFESSYGYILLSKKNFSVKVFLDPRYFAEGRQTIKNGQVFPLADFLSLWKKLKGTIGFEMNLPYHRYRFFQQNNPAVVLCPIDFHQLRIIKTAHEIEQLRVVCQKTAQIWAKTNAQLSVLRNEKKLEQFLIKQAVGAGVSEQSFFPIVSSGPSSALIHTRARNQLIQDNVICDFGLKLNGYCSDFTRSVILTNNDLKKYWQIVKNVHSEIIKIIKPGVAIAALAKLAHQIYDRHNLRLEHAIGHGIGLEVHEYPLIHQQNQQVLQPGMVFTIEPGIYLTQLGGVRIEDVVLVTNSGCEILTKS